MNRFFRLGNIILNLDHVVSIEFQPDGWAHRRGTEEGTYQRPILEISTTEITSNECGPFGRTFRFLDEDALAAWELLSGTLNEIDGKIMRYVDVTTG